MSSKASPWFAYATAVAVLGAGAGGAVVRQRMDFGTPTPVPPQVQTDFRSATASTESEPKLDEGEMFYRVVELLDQMYVEPIKDEDKLAVGGIKGMVQSLLDPEALYMTEEQFKAFQAQQAGKFEGIGAVLGLDYDEKALAQFRKARKAWQQRKPGQSVQDMPEYDPNALVPDVVVQAVIKGSGAEKAGMKPGDIIDGIDTKWVLSARAIKDLRKVAEELRNPKLPSARQEEIRKTIRDRYENSLQPRLILDKLALGKEGSLKVSWLSGTAKKSATVSKGVADLKPIEGNRISFITGMDTALKALPNPPVEIDLRNTPDGDFGMMLKALGAYLPTGNYGVIKGRSGQPVPQIEVESNLEKPIPTTITIDSSTGRFGLAFAKIMQVAGGAKIIGTFPSEPIKYFEVVAMPDGSGYTLPTGTLEIKKPQ